MLADLPPSVDRIRLHYKRLGLDQGWTRDRFNRLCKLLHWTPGELGALCCIEPARLAQWLRQGRFPTHASLVLRLIERAYLDAACGGVCGEPIIPAHLIDPTPTNTPRHD